MGNTSSQQDGLLNESQPACSDEVVLEALKKIEDVDVDYALARFSGVAEIYVEIVEYVVKKLKPDCEKLTVFLADGNMKSFEISVHTLKSSLAQAGIMELSKTAAKFETSARNKDFDFCHKEFPVFKEKLIKLYEEISPVFPNAQSYVEENFDIGSSQHLEI